MAYRVRLPCVLEKMTNRNMTNYAFWGVFGSCVTKPQNPAAVGSVKVFCIKKCAAHKRAAHFLS